MQAPPARDLLERVRSKALTSLKSQGNLLDGIAWSREVEERFFAAKCSKLPDPVYAIDHDAIEDESARLESLARSIDGDELEMLVAGRISLDDVVALVELRNLGLLARPKHRPTWLARWSTLLPYFAFASFMDEVDLGPVEAHYRELIALASAARPAAG